MKHLPSSSTPGFRRLACVRASGVEGGGGGAPEGQVPERVREECYVLAGGSDIDHKPLGLTSLHLHTRLAFLLIYFLKFIFEINTNVSN